LGIPGKTSDPVVEDAIDHVIEVAQDNHVIPGIHTSSVDKARYWIDRGMRMIGYCTDIKLILQVSKQSVQELQSAL
jgi:2-keto-3-deoxy-L-rhamnonate aldolase RhmA